MNLKLQSKSRTIYAFLMALFSVWGWGQTTVTLTTGTSWTVPANVYSLQVECLGGGGSGGSAISSSSGNRAAAGGGAGGAYAKINTIAVTPGTVINYSIGAGGTASSTIGAAGNGGDTWFLSNSTVLAKGGAGAVSVTGVSTLTSGIGGSGSTVGSIGDITYKGGDGANGLGSTTTSGYSGGGGSSAGRGVDGNNASGRTGGTAPTGGFASAAGVLSGNDGVNSGGTNYGAAGSGAYATTSNSQRFGGNGTRGRIIITYTLGAPMPSITASANYNTFNYVFGNGPSVAQSITASGANLDNTPVNVNASSDFEVSLDGNIFSNSQVIAYSNNAFTNQNIYVRLKSGLAGGSHSGTITISGGGAADIIKTVLGSVVYTVSAISNNTNFGTVSVVDNVITAAPSMGYTYANPAYTVVSGTATISQNGNQFTVTPSASTQIQINFEAKPTYTLSLMNNGTIYNNANFPFTTYEGNTIALPTLANCGNYTFVGWDTNNNATSSPIYTGGATYTTTSGNVTLYAVYSEMIGTPEQWTKVTNINDIVAGTYVIVNGGYFLPNTGTGSTGTPEQITLTSKNVTASGNALTGVIDGDMQWNLSGTNLAMAIVSTANSVNKLYTISDNNGVRVHTTSANWAFEVYSTGFAMKSSNDRFCAVYTSGNNWRSYTARNHVNYNTNDGILDLYKKTGGSTITYTTVITCGTNSTTWNGTTWSNGVPAATVDAIFTGIYTTSATTPAFAAKNITIKNGGVLEITSGNTISGVDVTVEDGGNLIQKDGSTLTYSGTFKTLKNGTSELNKFAFWSSPVVGQNLTNIYTGTTATSITEYDTAADYYVNATSTISLFGKAYSIQTPVTNAALVFEGTPNNGTQTFALATSGNGFNLIGNPYPSSLNLGTFYTANSARISSTFYFWDNKSTNVTLQNGASTTNYGYATFNAANGANPTWVPAPNGNGGTAVVPTGGVANIGQGFIVKTLNTSVDTSLTFNNEMRVATNGTFFNKNNPSTEGKFWLKLNSEYNTNNVFAVDYTNGASDSFDSYDSKAIAIGSDGFYTLADAQKLIIQGKASFDVDDVVPMGSKHFQNGNFTIALVQKEGLFNNGQAIYLHDKVTGTYTDLQNGAYTFTANAGESNNRFEIVYKLNVLATTEVQKDSFEVYRDGQDFVVRNNKNIEKVEIFDAAGRKIQTINENSKLIRVQIASKGVYILKALSEGKEYTKKLIK